MKYKSLLIPFLSILIAFLIWLYVMSTAKTTSIINVKLDYTLPDGFSLVSEKTKIINFTITGPKAVIRSLEKANDILKINVAANFNPSKMNYEFLSENLGFNIPFGITVENVIPSKIRVEIEESMTKEVPATIQQVGEIPMDHKLIKSTITPAVIKVTGARSIVDKIDKVATQVVNFSQITNEGNKELYLVKNDNRIRYDVKKVKFEYIVKTTRSNMVLKKIPIYFLTHRQVKSTDVRFANLMVLAENSKDLKLNSGDIKIVATVDNSLDKQTIKLEANLPENLHLLKIVPDSVVVELEKSEN